MHQLDITPLLIFTAANGYIMTIAFTRNSKAITLFTKTIRILSILGYLRWSIRRLFNNLNSPHRELREN